MLVEFYPWKIDVEISKTKELYRTKDFSASKEENQKFAAMLSEKQKDFFKKLGIDIMKIQVETINYGEKFDLSAVERVEEDNLLLAYDFDGLGTGIRFKHPVMQFEGGQFKTWDCGYVYGAMMIYSGE